MTRWALSKVPVSDAKRKAGTDSERVTDYPDHPPRLPPTCNWGLFGLGRILGHPKRQNKGAQIGRAAENITTMYYNLLSW